MNGKPTLLTFGLILFACSGGDVQPVDIHEEDACSFCRMAISEVRFAGELITTDAEVFKFDDIGCLRSFRETRLTGQVAGFFLKNFETGGWLNGDSAHVVRTGLRTPMGSGFIALSSGVRARVIAEQYPPEE